MVRVTRSQLRMQFEMRLQWQKVMRLKKLRRPFLQMSKLIIFPGQGAQYNEMAKDLYDNNSDARKLIDSIFSLVDYDLKEIMFFNSDDRLNDTKYTQHALFAHLLVFLKASNIKGDILLGINLGELAALVNEGVVMLDAGIEAAVRR